MSPEKEDQAAKALDKAEEVLRATEMRCAFGPTFFGTHLRGLIREQCPDPKESIPLVEIHLIGGEVLEVCHIIGLAPAWLALAVYDGSAKSTGRPMRTELVPYGAIIRITISKRGVDESQIGFNQAHTPFVVSAPVAATSPAAELYRLASSPPEATEK